MTCLVAKHSNFEGPVIRQMYKYNDNICDACLGAWSIWPAVCSHGKIFITSEKFKTKFDISLTQVCCFWSRNIHINREQSHPLKVSYFEFKFSPLVFKVCQYSTFFTSNKATVGKSTTFHLKQPRPQGFSLKKWVGREKALASAGHVSPRTP